ncbi:hypothetical protein ACOJTA_02615 [Malaciobacter sp. WC5094]
MKWISTFLFYFQANIFKLSKNTFIKAGNTTIGDGALTKDVKLYSVVGGTPATFIKIHFEQKEIKQLLQ